MTVQPSTLIALSYAIRQPAIVAWTPQADITAFELAQCLSLLIHGHRFAYVEDQVALLPEGARRHFTVQEAQS